MQGLDLMDSLDSSDWDQRLPPPAAKAAVQSLSVVVLSEEEAGRLRRPHPHPTSRGRGQQTLTLVCARPPDKGVKCPVCLLKFKRKEKLHQMPCKHLFHSSCILPWLNNVRRSPARPAHCPPLTVLTPSLPSADQHLPAVQTGAAHRQPGVRGVQEGQGELAAIGRRSRVHAAGG